MVALAAGAPGAGEAYNLASGRETTLGELAHAVVAAAGADKRVTFATGLRSGDPHRWVADVGRVPPSARRRPGRSQRGWRRRRAGSAGWPAMPCRSPPWSGR